MGEETALLIGYLAMISRKLDRPLSVLFCARSGAGKSMLQDSLAEQGLPPTRAEIAEALGFKSANAAEEHLRALQRKGVIELRPGASRGIQLKDSLRDQIGLPLIGRVAAGRPILAEENIEARYQIDPALFQPRPH